MNTHEVVPFLAVKDMGKAVAFYADGLGFELREKWVDEETLRWCRLQMGNAGLMLQQFRTEGHDSRAIGDKRGEGVVLCFFCDDAINYYREITSRGISAAEPFVGNGLWVVSVTDPDGYRLDFESPTEVAEETI
jgi:lactoylglutathione lyase